MAAPAQNEDPFEGFDELLDEKIREVQLHKLRIWVIRNLITAGLVTWLVRTYDWGIWVLYVWIPLALLSLVALLVLPRAYLRQRHLERDAE